MPKLTNSGDFISTIKASKALGVAVRTVQLWSDAGILPAWRSSGGHRYIARYAVERMMENQVKAGLHARECARSLIWRDRRLVTMSQNPTVQRASRRFVTDIGANLYRITASPEQGLIAFGEIQPHFVVVDSCLPNVNVLELLRFLRGEMSPSGNRVLLAISSSEEAANHKILDIVGQATSVVAPSRLYASLFKLNCLA